MPPDPGCGHRRLRRQCVDGDFFASGRHPLSRHRRAERSCSGIPQSSSSLVQAAPSAGSSAYHVAAIRTAKPRSRAVGCPRPLCRDLPLPPQALVAGSAESRLICSLPTRSRSIPSRAARRAPRCTTMALVRMVVGATAAAAATGSPICGCRDGSPPVMYTSRPPSWANSSEVPREPAAGAAARIGRRRGLGAAVGARQVAVEVRIEPDPLTNQVASPVLNSAALSFCSSVGDDEAAVVPADPGMPRRAAHARRRGSSCSVCPAIS